MRERAVTFGSHGGLVGVVTEPDAAPAADTPAVLLFNVGLNHHVGPHRLNVELARHLSERGFPTLRFDLSGLGDSEPRTDDRPDEEHAVVDLQEAMNFMSQRKAIKNFVVIGLCSGVDPAHVVAVSDSRIRGAVFMDGYAYTTRRYNLGEAANRAARVLGPANYKRWFRHRVLPVFGRRSALQTSQYGIFDRTFPPRAQFKADLEIMLARRVQILFFYTRQAYFFNHRAQFAAMIDLRSVPSGVEVEHQRGADHVFTSVRERAQCVRRVVDWVAAHFATAVNGSEAVSVSTPTAGTRATIGG